MFKTKSNPIQATCLALALSTTLAFGCADEGDDGGGFDNSYENHVQLTCNGDVLVDEIFTTRESCEAFRDANSFMCSGLELTVSC